MNSKLLIPIVSVGSVAALLFFLFVMPGAVPEFQDLQFSVEDVYGVTIADKLTVTHSTNWVMSEDRSPIDGNRLYVLTHKSTQDMDIENLEIPLTITIEIRHGDGAGLADYDDLTRYYKELVEDLEFTFLLMYAVLEFHDSGIWTAGYNDWLWFEYSISLYQLVQVAGADYVAERDGDVIIVSYSGMSAMYDEFFDEHVEIIESIKFL